MADKRVPDSLRQISSHEQDAELYIPSFARGPPYPTISRTSIQIRRPDMTLTRSQKNSLATSSPRTRGRSWRQHFTFCKVMLDPHRQNYVSLYSFLSSLWILHGTQSPGYSAILAQLPRAWSTASATFPYKERARYCPISGTEHFYRHYAITFHQLVKIHSNLGKRIKNTV